MAVHPIFYIQRFVCLFFYLFLNFFIIIFKIKFPWSLRNVFPKKMINCWCLTTPRSPLFPLQVKSCFLVVEPRTRVSRGFAFVTMETVEDASRCVKYLNQSVLEGRYITVERVIDYSFRGKTLTILIGLLSSWLGGFLVIFRTHCVSYVGSNQSKMMSSSISTLLKQPNQWQA